MTTPLSGARAVLFLGTLRDLLGLGGPRLENVDAKEAHRLQQNEGAILLDVRELHEWRDGHAPHAKHIPLGDLDRRLAQIPRGKKIVVTCASGMRSRAGAKKLLACGYTDVVNLKGGMHAWRRDGLPVQR